MSELQTLQFPIDMSPDEQNAVQGFINNGFPGISAAKEEKIKEAMELYFNGASYGEISQRVGVKKVILMYLSAKLGWYGKKMEILEGLALTLSQKAEIAHARGIDLVTDLMASFEYYYRSVIDSYRQSKDHTVLESADMENLKIYMKCMEQIQKFRNPGAKDKSPLMGISLPDGGTLKKIDDNTIEVSTNKNKTMEDEFGKVLSALAELRRDRENKG